MPTATHPAPRRLALLTAAATCALILVGGLVTGTGSGLAVPDWPTTFGYNMFLYPLSQMAGGVLYEHAHRLVGSVVGLLTVLLAAALFVSERRAWVRTLGVLAVLAVVVQGILGGLRVVLVTESLAMVHGAMAPGFLALLASIALFTSPAWTRIPVAEPARLRPLRLLAVATVAALYAQILFGVVLTHVGRRLDAHLAVAGLVSVLIPLLVRRTRALGMEPVLGRPSRLLLGLWAVQVALGLGAYGARFHGADLGMGPVLALGFPLAHRLTGALMLATATVVTLQIFHLTAPGRQPDRIPGGQRVRA